MIDKNKDELILGDGNIQYDEENHRHHFSITLNGVDERNYVTYVKNLITETFGKTPILKWERDKPYAKKNAKAVSLTISKSRINSI